VARPLGGRLAEIWLKKGVSDPVADTVRLAALDVGVKGLDGVRSGQVFDFMGDSAPKAIRAVLRGAFDESVGAICGGPVTPVMTAVDFLSMDSEGLTRLSKERGLSLNAEEMEAIQSYFRTQGRSPSDPELETLAQTWSEHCKHKTFRAAVHHVEERRRRVDHERQYRISLKETIVKVTDELNKPWCLVGVQRQRGHRGRQHERRQRAPSLGV
jgi:hypothetical protein